MDRYEIHDDDDYIHSNLTCRRCKSKFDGYFNDDHICDWCVKQLNERKTP